MHTTTNDGQTFTKASRNWLLLGVFALIASGLPALVLVIARTAGLTEGKIFKDMFYEALVIHVDLSVLVWFLTIACMIWSIASARCKAKISIPYLECSAWWAMALGAVLMVISPLVTGQGAYMSNYIPVIANPLFFFALGLIFIATLLMVVKMLLGTPKYERYHGIDFAFMLGAHSAALITLIALAAFVWSFRLMPEAGVLVGQQYYEVLFWGGGHVLQFTHGQILLVAWLVMLSALYPAFKLSRMLMASVLLFGLLVALVAPFAYLSFDIASQEFRLFFTRMMIMGGGIAPVIIGAVILRAFFARSNANQEPRIGGNLNSVRMALICSLLVFGYGGVLGLMIEGQNVIIPAHYHGSIVGITLAFMGLAVLYLPRFGMAPMAHRRIARFQPLILAVGQVMHVSALAWLGGHGVARKTPGAPVEPFADIAVQVMRFGGLLAILGGVLFVVIIVMSWKKRNA